MLQTNGNDGSVKVLNPARIERIISRLFLKPTPVIFRDESNAKISVRAKSLQIITHLVPSQRKLVFSGISENGLEFLRNAKSVRVELVGLPTQVLFHVKIVSFGVQEVVVTYPDKIVSLDRRANVRVAVGAQDAAFIKLSNWKVHPELAYDPPVPGIFSDLSGYLLLSDISEGGACVISRFPGVLTVVAQGMYDPSSQLILPMAEPIALQTEVRWMRRIKELVTSDQDVREIRRFTFGMQFSGVSEDDKMRLKQYMQKLFVADAI